jgi:4-alpha-glucanotransferase
MPALPTLHQRTSGLLLHPTSLPGPHGSGDLGPEAFKFAEQLAAAGQRWWQMLPVVPPSGGPSPYQSSSAFAGNPALISLVRLHEQGLLTAEEIAPEPGLDGTRIDFGASEKYREVRLRKAFEVFRHREDLLVPFMAWCHQQSEWLDDFVHFETLKQLHNDAVWTTWSEGARHRRADMFHDVVANHRAELRYHQFVQYLFAQQWQALRDHCTRLGIGLIGDIPIFVGHDSTDVWAHPELFHLDDKGDPTVVAGVPPDYFSATGQRWGNALYRWDVHRRTGYAWWTARFRSMLASFDAVRVDHFIGFHRYWEIKADCPTAVDGVYRVGPGSDLFAQLERTLGKIPVIAEDLGVVTPEVKLLRDQFGFPGMRLLQFAFGTDNEAKNYQPHAFPRSCVATPRRAGSTISPVAPRATRKRAANANSSCDTQARATPTSSGR